MKIFTTAVRTLERIDSASAVDVSTARRWQMPGVVPFKGTAMRHAAEVTDPQEHLDPKVRSIADLMEMRAMLARLGKDPA